MVKKFCLFAFNGEAMCFVHVLLNALDMKEKGYDVKVVIEGSATKLVKEFQDTSKPFANLYHKVKDAGLIDCVCEACANKMESLEAAKAQELNLCNELKGHPSIAKYIEEGYEVMTF